MGPIARSDHPRPTILVQTVAPRSTIGTDPAEMSRSAYPHPADGEDGDTGDRTVRHRM